MNKSAVLVATLVSALCAPGAFADSCKFSANRSGGIEAGGPVRKVVVGTGAGDLVVRGRDGAGVKADGRACASSQELLDQIQLETRREGDTVYIKTNMPSPEEGLFSFNRYAYLDLTIDVPRTVDVTLEDSSGDLELTSVHTATIVDSSGDQIVRDIGGDLDIVDSSGDVNVDRVAGNARFKDSSGDMAVNDVKGDIEVTVDSSGEIEMQRVGGSVHILSDSSGDIRLTDVKRDVTVDIDTSGDINVDQVGGSFTVKTDGSGEISHERVVGAVTVPDRH
jgi:DUF4097 and DUF4098 domain-containing protein YvlB